MHGTGNEFLVLDAFRDHLPAGIDLPALARAVCDRTSGPGADGLLVVEPADGIAGRMQIYNTDGSVAEMCGNGLRCVGKLLADRRYAGKEFAVATDAGPRQVTVLASNRDTSDVRITLGRPVFDPDLIPTTLAGRPPVEAPLSLEANGDTDPRPTLSVTCVSMGNPHAVIFVANPDAANVAAVGPLVERHAAFPKRTNVEFATVVSSTELRLRIWERGVGETAACGTGAAAAVVAGVLTGRCGRDIVVQLRGGRLRIHWPDDDSEVSLTGQAVATGIVTWP